MDYFTYGAKEIQYLKDKDEILGRAIEEIGMLNKEITSDPFKAIISSVVGQQISNKAADTVNERLVHLLGEITPENIHNAKIEEIQKCGLSYRKVDYIKGIGEAAINGTVDFSKLDELSDEEVIKQLTSLYGVGVWTAEMILIFSLGRKDVLSFKDLAIIRGMKRLYNLESISKEEFEDYRKTYSPYGSVASLYLWELSK